MDSFDNIKRDLLANLMMIQERLKQTFKYSDNLFPRNIQDLDNILEKAINQVNDTTSTPPVSDGGPLQELADAKVTESEMKQPKKRIRRQLKEFDHQITENENPSELVMLLEECVKKRIRNEPVGSVITGELEVTDEEQEDLLELTVKTESLETALPKLKFAHDYKVVNPKIFEMQRNLNNFFFSDLSYLSEPKEPKNLGT